MMLFLQLKIARLSANRTLLIVFNITRIMEKASEKLQQSKINFIHLPRDRGPARDIRS